MQTRCPYPHCLATFDAAETRTGLCARCHRIMSNRPIEMLIEVDKRVARMQAAGELAGCDANSTSAMPATAASVKADSSSMRCAEFSALAEDVRSLWNVGSIFRSADGAGVGRLYLCGISGTPPRKEITKVSLGSEETVPWTYVPSALPVLDNLKQQNVFILSLEYWHGQKDSLGIASSVELSKAIANRQIRFPLCMIVGNEVAGVSAEVLAASDLICHLPMRGSKESLNVAVAFGIAAYALAEVQVPRRA